MTKVRGCLPCHIKCSRRKGHQSACQCNTHQEGNKQPEYRATQMDTSSSDEELTGGVSAQSKVVVKEIDGNKLLLIPWTDQLTAERVCTMGIQKLNRKGIWLRKTATCLQNAEGSALEEDKVLSECREPGDQHLILTLRSTDYMLCEQGSYERWRLIVSNMRTKELHVNDILEISDHFVVAIGTTPPNWLCPHREGRSVDEGADLNLILVTPPGQQQVNLLMARKATEKVEVSHLGQTNQDIIPAIRGAIETRWGKVKLAYQGLPGLVVQNNADVLLRIAQLATMQQGRARERRSEAQLTAITSAYFRARNSVPSFIKERNGRMCRHPMLPYLPFTVVDQMRTDDSVPIGIKVCPLSPHRDVKLLYNNHMAATTTAFMYVDLREKLWPSGSAVAKAITEQNRRQIPLLVLRAGEGSLIQKKYIMEYNQQSTARECSECGKDATWLVRVSTPAGYNIRLEQTIASLYKALPWDHTDWLEGARYRFEMWLAMPPPPQ